MWPAPFCLKIICRTYLRPEVKLAISPCWWQGWDFLWLALTQMVKLCCYSLGGWRVSNEPFSWAGTELYFHVCTLLRGQQSNTNSWDIDNTLRAKLAFVHLLPLGLLLHLFFWRFLITCAFFLRGSFWYFVQLFN